MCGVCGGCRYWADMKDTHKGTNHDVEYFCNLCSLVMRAFPTEVTCETTFSRTELINHARRRNMSVEHLALIVGAWAWPEDFESLSAQDPRFAALIRDLHRGD